MCTTALAGTGSACSNTRVMRAGWIGGVLTLLLGAACDAGTGEGAGHGIDVEGGQTGDPGGGPTTCDDVGWDGPGSAMRRGTCIQRSGGHWECECHEYADPMDFRGFGTGPRQTVEAEDCSEALMRGCELDPDTSEICERDHLGTCWPGDATHQWECACNEAAEGERATASAERCSVALTEACGERCDNDFGRCSENEERHNQFSCACTGDTPPAVPADGGTMDTDSPEIGGTEVAGGGDGDGAILSCGQALDRTCGRTCTTEAGDCEADARGFGCACEDLSEVFVDLEDVGGIHRDACSQALARVCGVVLQAPEPRCDVIEAGASCEGQRRVWLSGEPEPEGFLFACRCQQSAEPQTVEAGACYRALVDACPNAIPPDVRPRAAPAGRPGARCDGDGDCDSGLCHVGEAQRDGVCSQACDGNADCPEGTLCIELHGGPGRCFVECGFDGTCELLNDATRDPLSCADRPDVSPTPDGDESGSICIPLSDHHF